MHVRLLLSSDTTSEVPVAYWSVTHTYLNTSIYVRCKKRLLLVSILMVLIIVTRPDCMLMHKVKVKFALEEAMKAQRGSRGIALLFL